MRFANLGLSWQPQFWVFCNRVPLCPHFEPFMWPANRRSVVLEDLWPQLQLEGANPDFR